MTTEIQIASAALMPVLYSWADRRVGFGGEKVLGPLGGRSLGLLCGAVVGAGLGYVAGGPAMAVLGPFWAVYRSLDFKHGAATPINNKQRVNAWLRHMLAVLVAGPIYLLGGDWQTAAIAFAVYAQVAFGLAYWLGVKLLEAEAAGAPWIFEWNDNAERARGAAFGLAAVLYLFLTASGG